MCAWHTLAAHTARASASAAVHLSACVSTGCTTAPGAFACRKWSHQSRRCLASSSDAAASALIGLLTFSVSLQYTMVIGDSFSSIFSAWGLPAPLTTRTGAILLLTVIGTLPLSLLPSLSALSFTSVLGVAGLLYTAAFMLLRVPAYAAGSALHAAVPAAMQPKFDDALSFSPQVFVLVSILASAFLCHFVAPQFFNELSPGPAPAAIKGKGATELEELVMEEEDAPKMKSP